MLSGEDNIEDVAILNGNCGHFHAHYKNGKAFGGLGSKCHLSISLAVEE